jgi:hypothetical protein
MHQFQVDGVAELDPNVSSKNDKLKFMQFGF